MESKMKENKMNVNVEQFGYWMSNNRNKETLQRRINKSSSTVTFSNNDEDVFIFNPNDGVICTFMNKDEFETFINKHTL